MAAGDKQRIEIEPARLLHRRSELAYTDRLAQALHDEPEAVPESVQRQITRDAQRRDREQRLHAWGVAHREITNTLAKCKSSCRVDAPLTNALRVIERQAVTVDRRVAK